MGLLDLDLGKALEDGANNLLSKIKSPFEDFFAEELDMKGSLERKDFDSFEMLEFENNEARTSEQIILRGDMMPHVPFVFGGKQQMTKDYYPGNTEPTVHVLGSRENNITIKGRLKSKRLQPSKIDGLGKEELRRFPQEMQRLIEAMRIRGNIVQIKMGEFKRFAFMEEASFKMKTLADMEYIITFAISYPTVTKTSFSIMNC